MRLKVGLVVPVLNNFDQAVDLIYSAKTNHELKIYIIPQYRHQIPLAAAWNRGILSAMGDHCNVIIVSNDDVLFGPQTINDLADHTYAMGEQYAMAYPVDVLDELDDPSEIFWSMADYSHVQPKEDQTFSCFAIRPGFFDKCGTFDENFDPAWWEDTDMKYRMKLLGYKTLQTAFPYVHLRHQTTQKLNLPLNSTKSGEYYYKKWGSNRKDLTELFKTPYNNPSLSPKEWKKL